LPIAPKHCKNSCAKISIWQIPMKNRPESNPGTEPAAATSQDDVPDLLQGAKVFRSVYPSADIISDDDETARLPKITSLPEGIEVVEGSVCRAVGQWVLMVRCQCGKRWFELEAIDAATCPRCNALVYIDVLQARPG
jgi:hypothetical protein